MSAVASCLLRLECICSIDVKESDDLCVCTALRKASRAITRVYDDALASHGLTTPQFAILRLIGKAPDMALTRLATDLVMDRSTLYRSIGPLERQGWIALRVEGARAKHVDLTDTGRALLAAATADWAAVQTRVTKSFGRDAWTDLEKRLVALTAVAPPPSVGR